MWIPGSPPAPAPRNDDVLAILVQSPPVSGIGTAGILPACRRDGGNPTGADAGLRPACRLEAGGPVNGAIGWRLH
jgi:hypothetical protein